MYIEAAYHNIVTTLIIGTWKRERNTLISHARSMGSINRQVPKLVNIGCSIIICKFETGWERQTCMCVHERVQFRMTSSNMTSWVHVKTLSIKATYLLLLASPMIITCKYKVIEISWRYLKCVDGGGVSFRGQRGIFFSGLWDLNW